MSSRIMLKRTKRGQIGQWTERCAATCHVRGGRLFIVWEGERRLSRAATVDSATIARYELRELARLEIRHDPVFDVVGPPVGQMIPLRTCRDRKSTRLNSSHMSISYAVFCLKKKIK